MKGQYIHRQTQGQKHSIETEALSEQNQCKRAKRTSAGTPSATKDGPSSQLPDRNEANDVSNTLLTQTEIRASRNSDLGNAQLREVQLSPSDNPIPVTSQDPVPFQECDPFRDFDGFGHLGDFDPFHNFYDFGRLGDFDPFHNFYDFGHLGDFDPFKDLALPLESAASQSGHLQAVQ